MRCKGASGSAIFNKPATGAIHQNLQFKAIKLCDFKMDLIKGQLKKRVPMLAWKKRSIYFAVEYSLREVSYVVHLHLLSLHVVGMRKAILRNHLKRTFAPIVTAHTYFLHNSCHCVTHVIHQVHRLKFRVWHGWESSTFIGDLDQWLKTVIFLAFPQNA